jgi:hypothetical protein
MRKLKISLPDETYKKMSGEAASLGFSVNALVRLRLCERAMGLKFDVPEKPYLFSPKNWREIEAYLRVKRPELTVSQFAVEAVDALMKRNGLTALQKTEVEALLKK